RKRAIKKKFLAIDVDEADKLIFRAFVDLAATMARIDKRSQSHPREVSGALCCNVAEQMRNHALGKIICLDLVGDFQLLQFRHQPPMSANYASHKTFVAKMIESSFLAIPLAGGVDQREITWLLGSRSCFITLREIERLYRQGDFFGKANTNKAACCNRVPGSYEAGRFLRCDNLSAIECLDRRKR